jgi:predicted ribosome quality control (RQC) complex YloA/Tae2 family protein
MKHLTSIEVSAIVKELQELIGSKVSKIYQPDNTEIVIEFFKTSKGKFLLRLVPGTATYITTYKRPNPKNILSFCKFLRKRLTNVFLEKIEQKHFERIIEFRFKTKETVYYLIIELFSKGNIIFCDKDYKIISALQVQLWKDRKIKANETYSYPPTSNTDIFQLTEKGFKDIVLSSDKENIVKILAIDIGLGGLYSEELCLRSGVDKNTKSLDDKDIAKLYFELKKMAKLTLDPCLYKDDATPFPLLRYHDQEFTKLPTFNEALNRYYSKFFAEEKQNEAQKAYEKKLLKEKKILEEQEHLITELENASEFNKEKGDLIYKNYSYVKEVFDAIKLARSKNVPWEEIEEKLKSKNIIVKGKECKVTLELK